MLVYHNDSIYSIGSKLCFEFAACMIIIPSNLAATTEVQSASIIKGGHHVNIMCQLSLGSRAKGCRVYMQIMNPHSSASTETQLLNIPRSDNLRAERCIRLPKTLVAYSFQVFDWNEQNEIGSMQVPSTVIKSIYAPCKDQVY